MPEQRVEVRPFGVRYICDACKQGEMMALSGAQALFQEGEKVLVRHVCNVCRTLMAFPEKYPTVRYEDVPQQSYGQQNYGLPQQQAPQGAGSQLAPQAGTQMVPQNK
jgi:hypothetical protein